jgi:hypothetical protein
MSLRDPRALSVVRFAPFLLLCLQVAVNRIESANKSRSIESAKISLTHGSLPAVDWRRQAKSTSFTRNKWRAAAFPDGAESEAATFPDP